MIKENARVIEVRDDVAVVETQRKVACQSCAVNKGCGTGVIARVLGNKRFLLEVLNPVQARVGEEVVVGIEDKALVSSSLLAYAMPLVLMIAGGIVGDVFSRPADSGGSEGVVILFSLGGFAAGLWLLRRVSRRMASDARYRPVILSRKEVSPIAFPAMPPSDTFQH